MLDTVNERQLYEQAAAAQIDVVSVGRREGLLPFHVVLLELLGDGSGRSAGAARGFPPSDRHDRESFAVVGRRGSNDVWGVLYRPA